MSKDRAHNWWGAAWVEKLERLAEPSRFAEGEQYARTGRVPAIRFDGRTIAAKVQGPHEPPYMVRISFDPFSREQWDGVWVEVRDRGALASSIPSGDLPMEIQTAFSKVKLRFMPERYVDLEFRHFFLQPMDGPNREDNTQGAIRYCLEHPRWRLSLQTQKYLGIP